MTGSLAGFKPDFIKGSYHSVEERPSDTTNGKTSIVGEGIAACAFKDDNEESYASCAKIAYSPQSEHNLIAPQQLGIQDREKGTIKNKHCRCELDNKEAALYFDEHCCRVTIKHDPKMLILALNINPGIKNFQPFNISFNNVI